MSADTPLTRDDFEDVGLDAWRELVAERLGDASPDSLNRSTVDGVDLAALYTEAEGETRSLPNVARGGEPEAGWRICARIDQGSAVEAAAGMALVKGSGADGFWLGFDRAARLGIEADAGEAVEHLGDGGVAIHHGSDLQVLFEGATLGGVTPGHTDVWLDAGGNALPATALWLCELKRRGIDLSDTRLHCGADPLGALARDGRIPRDLMKIESEMAVLARFSSAHLDGGRAIVVSTEPYHAAGAGTAQELAYAVATTAAYLRALKESGLGFENAAGEIALRLAVGPDLFVEIAKLRAARVLWSMLLGACDVSSRSHALIHAVGSERSLTRRDPWNNLLRGTGQVFAAACGGADLVTLPGFDRALGPSDERALRLAQTMQLVLAEEALLGRVSDPASGAYLVERLTRELARQAWGVAQEIERRGGMKALLLSGEIAVEVADSAASRRQMIAGGVRPITGVSLFPLEGERPLERSSPDPAELVEQARLGLEAHRDARRDELCREQGVVYSRDFVIDQLVAEAGRGATLAELSARLGDDEGAERLDALPLRRDAEPFERDFGQEGLNDLGGRDE